VAVGGASDEKLKESKDDLVRLKLLDDSNDELKLAKELEPAFLIIHQPKKVWKFYRDGLLDVGEDYFCWLAGAAVQITIGPEHAYNIIKYPYTEELALEWFESEFMKDIEVPEEGLIDQQIILGANEMLFLTMMQTIYKKRYEKDGRLENIKIGITELMNFTYWSEMPESIDGDSLEFYKLHVKNGEETLRTLAELKVKGLINIEGAEINYSIIGQEIYSPNRLIEHMYFAEYGEETKIATLNVLRRGYLLTRPYGQESKIVIDILNKDIPREKLFNLLTDEAKIEQLEKKEYKDADSKFCSNCGNEVPIDAKFCKHCGNAFAEEKKVFCKDCGTEIKEDTLFCPNCGTRR
jgi:RNA polymerase subunit RPABC4/transcription elongation factor Spt4